MLKKPKTRFTFVDEKTFCTGDIHRPSIVRTFVGDEERRSKAPKAYSINCFGLLCEQGCFCIPIAQGLKIDAQSYRSLWSDQVLPRLRSMYSTNALQLKLVQDNCPSHVASGQRAWLVSQGLEVLPHPPQSPDLNVMEEIWACTTLELKRRYPNEFASKQEFSDAILHCFQAVANRREFSKWIILFQKKLHRIIGAQGQRV